MATAYTAIAAEATSGTVRARPNDARKVIAPAGRRARSDPKAPMRDAVVPARRVGIVRARSVTIPAGASTATPSPTGGPNVREGETRQLATSPGRSEERRVGKECRSWGWPGRWKKKREKAR